MWNLNKILSSSFPPLQKKKKISFTVSGFDGQKCEEKLKEFRETLGLV